MKMNWSLLTAEQNLLLAILNEHYDEATLIMENNQSLDYHLFLDLLVLHRINPLILDRMLKNRQIPFPEKYVKIAKLDILRNQAARKLRMRELIVTTSLLYENGFDITLLKGLSYDPDDRFQRVFRDVDILIDESKILKVIKLLQDRGYKYEGSHILSEREKEDIKGQLSWNNQYQFKCPQSQQSIEIHTNLFERDRIRFENLTFLLDHPEIFKEKRVWNESLRCHVPCPEASLLLLCLHCSLKRSLAENKFILRHISDMDILFLRGFDSSYYLNLCNKSQTTFHQAFSLNLYKIIKRKKDFYLADVLAGQLTRKERKLMNYHLSCMENLFHSNRLKRIRYNLIAPFIIGGSPKQRFHWIVTTLFNRKVVQEHRYIKYGIRRESPLIYLTYLINPLQTSWQFLKKIAKNTKR